jgi:alkylated DNA repair dioxygenase AlkB
LNQQSLFPFLQTKAKQSLLVPQGLRYFPDFLSETEEQGLVMNLSKLPLKPFEFHGYIANRRVLSFGLHYDYSRQVVQQSAEPPPFLADLRGRIAWFCERGTEDFKQIGINEYRSGAGIGWHKDKPEFGEVVGISLVSAVIMRFRKRSGERWVRAFQMLEPRSIYILAGEARQEWEHSIAPVSSARYSVTFRTLAPGTLKLPTDR